MGEPMDDGIILRTHLRRHMRRTRLTPRALSIQSGGNEHMVSQILSGRSKSPRSDTVRRMADALGIATADLTGETELAHLAGTQAQEARQEMVKAYTMAGDLREEAEAEDGERAKELRYAANLIDKIDGPYHIATMSGVTEFREDPHPDPLAVYPGAAANVGEMVISPSPAQHISRPHVLDGSESAFAAHVFGDLMAPAYEEGDLILVDPNREPEPETDVLLVKHQPAGNWLAVVRRLVAADADGWRVRRYRPLVEETLSADDWPDAYAIVGKYTRR